TSRTCNTDAFATDLIGDVDVVELYRLPFEEILDIDILDLVDAQFAFHPTVRRWYNPHLYLVAHTDINKLVLPLRRKVLDGNDEFVDAELIDDILQFPLCGTENPRSVEHLTDHVIVVLHETYNLGRG